MGGAVVGVMGILLLLLTRQNPVPAAAAEPGAAAPFADGGSGSPPDISNMSPRERFDRLFNRVMKAAESGDEATVTRFTPMALMAYAQLDTLDADARYHAALIKLHTGDVPGASALADTILAKSPGHLFGYVVQGTVARFEKDKAGEAKAYADFLKHYDAEIKANRPEYAEHQRSIDDFHKSALGGQS